MNLTLYANGVENPANLARIGDAARLLGATLSASISGRLIAVENVPGASHIYGRRPLSGEATLALGNERRGLSRRTLEAAEETVLIPTLSRTVTTLNVAAAAAVAGWYVLRGSGSQARATRPERRRPTLLIVGEEHVEVGSSLRSAAAFGYRDVLLEDRGGGWFDGSGALRREARAAARRHKNRLFVHRSAIESAAGRYEEVVLAVPSGPGTQLQRTRLAHGRRQLVIVGATPDEVERVVPHARIASLGLEPVGVTPLRLSSSIVLAEIARQVGRRRPLPERALRAPRYEKALQLVKDGEILLVEPEELLSF